MNAPMSPFARMMNILCGLACLASVFVLFHLCRIASDSFRQDMSSVSKSAVVAKKPVSTAPDKTLIQSVCGFGSEVKSIVTSIRQTASMGNPAYAMPKTPAKDQSSSLLADGDPEYLPGDENEARRLAAEGESILNRMPRVSQTDPKAFLDRTDAETGTVLPAGARKLGNSVNALMDAFEGRTPGANDALAKFYGGTTGKSDNLSMQSFVSKLSKAGTWLRYFVESYE